MGGGIGGLAAAHGARLAGWDVRLVEQAAAFSEAGAGIQLGPNATTLLREWGFLQGEFARLAASPARLRVRDAGLGRELASLELGPAFEQRYGAPYLTVHRADLQQALLNAVGADGTRLHQATRVRAWREAADSVLAKTDAGEIEADALLGADGLWSCVRQPMDAPLDKPRATGHLAYRTLLRQADLPAAARSMEVTAWLGPRMHVVTYPVRGGEWLNLVCLVEGAAEGDPRAWDHPALAAQLESRLPPVCSALQDLLRCVGQWRLWALHDRPPVSGAHAMASGRVALLGDAAHPMLPYLAQGAGMALEDARELQRVLTAVKDGAMDVPTALKRYALNRWQRCARVQRRSQRNAWIFHASGLVRMGRDVSMRVFGASLLDMPWLYGGRG